MRRALVGITLAALLLGGCGNGAEADVRRFCELIEQYNKGTGFEQPEQDTPEALTTALRDYLKLPEVQEILTELREVAPGEVRPHVETMTDVANELVETGKSRFEEPEAAEANEQIVAFTSDKCAPKETPSESGEAPAEGEAPPAEGGDTGAAEGEPVGTPEQET